MHRLYIFRAIIIQENKLDEENERVLAWRSTTTYSTSVVQSWSAITDLNQSGNHLGFGDQVG